MNIEQVKIDICHADLIYGLVVSRKPKSILELGFGGGRATDKIVEGVSYNQNNPRYVLVDNWCDFGYKMPDNVKSYKSIEIVTSNEKEYILNCQDKFDFILSDADHNHTNEWFDLVYEKVLAQNGILIYHDIDVIWETYPNLLTILSKCKDRKLSHFLFNYDSLISERCERGLLVIFKT